jgi:hypothetical protein
LLSQFNDRAAVDDNRGGVFIKHGGVNSSKGFIRSRLQTFHPSKSQSLSKRFGRWSKTNSTLRRNQIALPDNPNYSFALLLSQRLLFHFQDPEKQCPPLT